MTLLRKAIKLLINNLDARYDFVDEKTTVKQMSQLMTAWKASPVKLKQRFDLDRNG